jgi:hypothetical protein
MFVRPSTFIALGLTHWNNRLTIDALNIGGRFRSAIGIHITKKLITALTCPMHTQTSERNEATDSNKHYDF